MSKEAMKLALVALSMTESDCGSRALEREQEAVTALRAALAEQPAPVQQEPVAFEIAYANALKESNSGTLKDIAKLCYQAALIVQTTAPFSQKPSWYHKHWGDGDDIFYRNTDTIPDGATPLYTSPPAQRKPLPYGIPSPDELEALSDGNSGMIFNEGFPTKLDRLACWLREYAAIEAAHSITGEKK